MRLPLNWLHEYCDPGLAAPALAERLALTGTKDERIHHHGVGALEAFVVGRVLSAERHPQADRLSVCRVEVGDGDPKQIVCGAPNVAAGQIVAVARPGAVMPDGTKLRTARLRGVESDGMILAEDELAIGTDHDGIMVLGDGGPGGAGRPTPGTPLSQVLPIATEVLELEITPNRPDCLGVYGVAREVHAATGAPLAPAPWATDSHGSEGDVEGFRVEVRDPDLCPRFTLRLFEDVQLGPSPPWLKARLMAAGQRPISNVVDITNYVMLLAGQPMHAFDADLVAGGVLVVRRARAGERVTTLDDVERELDADTCLIEDADGPTSIAGIMGGARSEVRPGTTRVLMEAATWNGPNLQRTSTRLGLRTEASGRFEKGLSREQGLEGQALTSRLMVELCGARAVPGTIDVGGPGSPPAPLRLRDARVERLLGAPIPRAECAELLERLGFGVDEAPDGLEVRVPHWRRADVTREADLVEEVARLAGLDRLPVTLPSRREATGRLTWPQKLRRRAEDALCGAGLTEAVGWSFTTPDLPDRLLLGPEDARRRLVALANPMSEDQSVMRSVLLGSLLDAAQRNRARGFEDVRLWEFGAVYWAREDDRDGATGDGHLPVEAVRTPATPDERFAKPASVDDARLPHEDQHLGALLTGRLRPPTWREAEPPRADFFAAKGLLGTLMDALRVEWRVTPTDAHAFLHPGRAATVLVDGRPAGWLGELHPRVAERWDLEGGAAFELRFGALTEAARVVPRYEDLTSFPAVRQDLAFDLPDAVPAADLLATVRRAAGALLQAAEVFDRFELGEGRTSLALHLEFRAPDRTLTDEEVAGRRERIVAAVRTELGGELRGG